MAYEVSDDLANVYVSDSISCHSFFYLTLISMAFLLSQEPDEHPLSSRYCTCCFLFLEQPLSRYPHVLLLPFLLISPWVLVLQGQVPEPFNRTATLYLVSFSFTRIFFFFFFWSLGRVFVSAFENKLFIVCSPQEMWVPWEQGHCLGHM